MVCVCVCLRVSEILSKMHSTVLGIVTTLLKIIFFLYYELMSSVLLIMCLKEMSHSALASLAQ